MSNFRRLKQRVNLEFTCVHAGLWSRNQSQRFFSRVRAYLFQGNDSRVQKFILIQACLIKQTS